MLSCVSCFSVNVFAAGSVENSELDILYEEQLDDINSQRLFDSLPQNTKDSLSELGITSANYQQLSSLDVRDMFTEIISIVGRTAGSPLCGMGVCIGIILLCTLTEGVRLTSDGKKLSTVQGAVASMCVCTAIVVPLCRTISDAADVLAGASGFMLLYVPILAGLVISSGNEITGTSYYTSMMTVGNIVSNAASRLVMPLMNVFLALSVTSSVSPGIRINSLCTSVYNIAKWVLTFVMSVFITVMSLNTMVTSSMDNVSSRALKFTVSSFVPVVGNVLGEALTTFSGSLELLKTGAGVFVIIASAFIILPVLMECVVWQFSLFLLSSVAEISGLDRMTGLFKGISKAVGMVTALLLCVMTVFIISTVMILLAGRQGVY